MGPTTKDQQVQGYVHQWFYALHFALHTVFRYQERKCQWGVRRVVRAGCAGYTRTEAFTCIYV